MKHVTVRANGQRIHLVEQGEGPLVMLLHGFPEGWHTWSKIIPVIADAGYRVVAPDMRGYGQSSKPAAVHDYRITELVADMVGVVEALGETTAVIAGHDFGSIVAWTSAWTRPDVFRAVVGMSVPFGGRNLVPVAGAGPFGELKPADFYRKIAGDDKLFYSEYWSLPGMLENQMEEDVYAFFRGFYYSASAAPIPADMEAPDVFSISYDEVLDMTRNGWTCLTPDQRMVDMFVQPDELPGWLEEDLDFYVGEFSRTGLTPAVNYYRCNPINWELLAPFQGRPVDVPAMFIGADFDLATTWGAESIALFSENVPKLTEIVMLERCGHWFMREQPEEVSAALLRFLAGIDGTN